MGLGDLHIKQDNFGHKKLLTAIGEDLEVLETRMVGAEANVGKAPTEPVFTDCYSAWDGLTVLHHEVTNLALAHEDIQDALQHQAQNITEVKENTKRFIQDIQHDLTSKTDITLKEIQTSLSSLSEFAKLLSLEQERLTEHILDRSNSISTLDLEWQVNELRGLVMQARSPGNSNLTLESLQAELKLLDARLPMSMNGRIGGEMFQSRTDVLFLWRTMSRPTHSTFFMMQSPCLNLCQIRTLNAKTQYKSGTNQARLG
jgi:hypothetical protein